MNGKESFKMIISIYKRIYLYNYEWHRDFKLNNSVKKIKVYYLMKCFVSFVRVGWLDVCIYYGQISVRVI